MIGIPRGLYCHDSEWRTCIYWDMIKDLPYQENGYCFLMGKSDWDINEEYGEVEITHHKQNPHRYSYESAHILTVSLLWDRCKECGYLEE